MDDAPFNALMAALAEAREIAGSSMGFTNEMVI